MELNTAVVRAGAIMGRVALTQKELPRREALHILIDAAEAVIELLMPFEDRISVSDQPSPDDEASRESPAGLDLLAATPAERQAAVAWLQAHQDQDHQGPWELDPEKGSAWDQLDLRDYPHLAAERQRAAQRREHQGPSPD